MLHEELNDLSKKQNMLVLYSITSSLKVGNKKREGLTDNSISRALQKFETVEQVSREALRSEIQGDESRWAVHHEVLRGQVTQMHYTIMMHVVLGPSASFHNLYDARANFFILLHLSGSSATKIDVNSIADMDNRELVQLQREAMKGKDSVFPLWHVIEFTCTRD